MTNKPKTQHTPGPWEPRAYRGTRHAVYARNPYKDSKYLMVVADVEARAQDKVTQEIAVANARLIAAAPELLEAAKEAIREIEAGHTFEAIQELSAAIAKAGGR